MKEEFDIIKKNIRLSKELDKLSFSVFCSQTEELVMLCSNKRFSFYEISDIFSNIFDYPLLSVEFAYFCKKLADNQMIYLENSSLNQSDKPTVAFLSNDYSNFAFDKLFSNDKAIGDNEFSFNSALEAVYSGRCDYALIPLFNSSDGLIVSLYRLIMKYELKIASSARTVMADGMSETDFCLVSKYEADYENANRAVISITHPTGDILPSFLYSVTSAGIKVLSVTTLPLGYTDARSESVILLDIENYNLKALKCFLSIGIPDALCIGIYNLK